MYNLNKYLKYKNKYLNLKKILHGGTIEDIEWRIYAKMHHFNLYNECKIAKSFNGDGGIHGASKYDIEFRESSEEKRIKILELLGIGDHHYFLCEQSNIVIFYKLEKLYLLLSKLYENSILISKEELLSLPCLYSHTRNIEETLLIAMLYGNIYPSNSNNDELPYSIYDEEFGKPPLINLKNAYINYLNLCNESLISNSRPIENYRSITSIKEKKKQNLKKNQLKTKDKILFVNIFFN